MGMFNWVTAPGLRCQACDAPMPDTGWQTKDMAELTCGHVTVRDVVVGGTFYHDCPACGAWNEWRKETVADPPELTKVPGCWPSERTA